MGAFPRRGCSDQQKRIIRACHTKNHRFAAALVPPRWGGCGSGGLFRRTDLRGWQRAQPRKTRFDVNQGAVAHFDCRKVAAPERVVAGSSGHAANCAPGRQRRELRFRVGQNDTPASR